MTLSFDSVNDFLRKARKAKEEETEALDEWAKDFANDPSTVGVPLSFIEEIECLIEKHGDETLRQIAIFCLGKWHNVHASVVQEMAKNEDIAGCSAASMDAARIGTAIQILDGVGSFGGDDSWRVMLKETIVSEMEEKNIREQGRGD